MAEFNDFEIDMDLTEVPTWDGDQQPLVPIGDYELVIKNVENKPAKSSGNPMIAVTFEVASVFDAPGIEDPSTLVGMKVWNNYSLSEKAQGRIKALMVAAGATLSKFRASELLEAHIRASVIHTEGGGTVGADGQAKPGRTFANVVKEAPLEAAAAVSAPTPPAAKANAKAAATKAPATSKPGARQA